MLHIGCHLSIGRGYAHMGREALSIRADTFQFFTRNPRGGRAKPLDVEDIGELRALLEREKFAPVVAHAPYTLNACSRWPATRDLSRDVLADDLARLEHLPGNYYTLHPGSHGGQGVEAATKMIASLLNEVLRPEQATIVLLETMSGKGSEVGGRFEELAGILDKVHVDDRMGVCLDTCHVYAAGYDIVNDLDGVLDAFDRVLGLGRLRAVHLNDSRIPYASHKDRHAGIGEGTIGLEALSRLVTHPRLRHVPFILETPNEVEGYAREIALLRSVADAGPVS